MARIGGSVKWRRIGCENYGLWHMRPSGKDIPVGMILMRHNGSGEIEISMTCRRQVSHSHLQDLTQPTLSLPRHFQWAPCWGREVAA